MKPSTLIVFYLWKDTWKRWCEQPGSPAARLFVTGLLVLVATVILTAFQLVERSLRERLESFGLNTLVVRRAVTPDSSAFFRHGTAPDDLAILAPSGRKLRLRQLFVRGQTEWEENNLLVLTYPPEALPMLAEILSPQTTAICVSDSLPENAQLRVRISHRSVVSSVARPPQWLRSLAQGDFLLVPQGWLDEEERLGWLETTVFQRGPTAAPMEQIIAAVKALSSAEQRPAPQMQSALPLLRELDELHRRHQQWRGVLAGILGAAVSLVYGAIAVLEFRQNLFVGALLRSFGASAWLLYFRQWLENAALANLAAIGAIFLIVLLRQTIFGTLGFPGELLAASDANLQATDALITILVWINVGAFLSSLPVAAGLRQPVGEILN
ncbi:MAG: hypothetical protein JWR19_3921 [Pedosphaera sp.]|nr:hypothetical protein [Pedosphaera sp.]